MTFGPAVTVHPLFRRRISAADAALSSSLATWIREDSGDPTRGATSCRSTRARGRVPPDKVFLYFHWFRETSRKLWFLRTMATRQPEIRSSARPTASWTCSTLRLRACRSDALSAPPMAGGEADAVPFRRLYAAPRARTRASGSSSTWSNGRRGEEDIPIAIQITADHYGKFDAATRADIARPKATGYPAPADPRDALAGGVRGEFPGRHLPAALRSRRIPRPRQRRHARCVGPRMPDRRHGPHLERRRDRAVRRRPRACESGCR